MFWASKDEVKESSKKDLIEYFKILEQELDDKPYFGGETFGYIDLALVPYYTFFYTFQMLGNINMEVECRKLMVWAKRCFEKEIVSKSLCDQHKVYEIILEIKRKL